MQPECGADGRCRPQRIAGLRQNRAVEIAGTSHPPLLRVSLSLAGPGRVVIYVDDGGRSCSSLVLRPARDRDRATGPHVRRPPPRPGEFAVPEGGERALFAVLSGKIEVVKTIDGVERTLGWRLPGTIFGEVPIALGTPFPGGYRAVGAVARDARRGPAVLRHRGGLAGHLARRSARWRASARRAAEHRRRAAQAARDDGRPAAGIRACGDLRRFLARNQISFNWLTPDAPELATLWPGTPPPDSDGPVLRLADGEVVVRPEVRDLANRLGLQTSARLERVRRRDRRRRAGRSCGGGLRRIRRAAHDRRRARGARRAGRHVRRASRTISGFPAASRATSSPAARCSRRSGSVPKSWSRARSRASIRRRARCCSTAATSCARGPSFSPPASRGVASPSRASTG